MVNTRINKRVFLWSLNKANYRVKNCCHRVCTFFTHLNMEHLCNQNYNFETRSVIEGICLVLDEYCESQWFQKVNQERAISEQGRNKLRTYRQHKTEFKAKNYLIKVMNRKHHSALAKFSAGVAPIRLEIGRYEGLEVDDRICPICKNEIETEEHVITRCPSYIVS